MTITATDAAASIQIERLARQTMLVPIVGTAPLIVHRFSEKAKRQMLDAQQGVKRPKEHRDPKSDYEGSLYTYSTADGEVGYGFPSVGFKSAMVSAARVYGSKAVRMTELRQGVFVDGILGTDGQKLIALDGEPESREDVVRIGVGTTDLRYRGMFTEWRAILPITYIERMFSRDSVLALIEAGGVTCGIGEWRPEKDGDFGTFEIDGDREIMVEG